MEAISYVLGVFPRFWLWFFPPLSTPTFLLALVFSISELIDLVFIGHKLCGAGLFVIGNALMGSYDRSRHLFIGPGGCAILFNCL